MKSNSVMAADGSQEVAKDAMHIVTIDTCNLIKGKPESGDGSICLSVVQFTVFCLGSRPITMILT